MRREKLSKNVFLLKAAEKFSVFMMDRQTQIHAALNYEIKLKNMKQTKNRWSQLSCMKMENKIMISIPRRTESFF